MSIFRYEAIDASGKVVMGAMDAPNEANVSSRLAAMGYRPMTILAWAGNGAKQAAGGSLQPAVGSLQAAVGSNQFPVTSNQSNGAKSNVTQRQPPLTTHQSPKTT